jgi:hypothetical protein
LTPKQAADIGYWTYQNHYVFYSYIAKRWSRLWDAEDTASEEGGNVYIKNHWIQSKSTQGDLIDYPISGLWWSFHLTVDHKRQDKYELTKILFKNVTQRTKQLGQARFAKHKPAMLGLLAFVKESASPKNSMETLVRAAVPYINLIGGIRPLTYFDENWFLEKLRNRFKEQLAKSEPVFKRPESQANLQRLETHQPVINEDIPIFDRYFCLNATSGEYILSTYPRTEYDFCVGYHSNLEGQFLIHFYKEGKIKKTNLDESFRNRKVDRSTPYMNGKCPGLTLLDVQLINQPVLFGIAHKTDKGVLFKAMDEQNTENFRNDNSELRQEGKKVLYIGQSIPCAFKILPVHLKEALGSLVQTSPTSKGSNLKSRYFNANWRALSKYWPELIKGEVEW